MNIQTSRRNFLSSIAILSAGTAIAGSPVKIFSSNNEVADLRNKWKSFLKIAGAKEYDGFADLNQSENIPLIKGHLHEQGKLVFFEKENLLAQPTWIYWQNNKYKPADIIINVFENKYPYKKLRALNRFELEALLQFSKKTEEENLLLALCTQKGIGHKTHAIVITKIQKKSPTQEIAFYKNGTLLRNEKLIYNA